MSFVKFIRKILVGETVQEKLDKTANKYGFKSHEEFTRAVGIPHIPVPKKFGGK
jgi:hypothetical protein